MDRAWELSRIGPRKGKVAILVNRQRTLTFSQEFGRGLLYFAEKIKMYMSSLSKVTLLLPFSWNIHGWNQGIPDIDQRIKDTRSRFCHCFLKACRSTKKASKKKTDW